MPLTQEQQNLLLFLDPGKVKEPEAWHFVPPQSGSEGGWGTVIAAFPGRRVLGYYWQLLLARLAQRPVRPVLFLQDGLLSCYFDAGNTECYRAYARKHLPAPKGLRRRLAMLVTPVWRAEQRFIVYQDRQQSEKGGNVEQLAGLDFMFFSNAPGKLILTKASTMLTGAGQLLITSATAAYLPKLVREYAIMARVAHGWEQSGLPGVRGGIEANGRFFFQEEYVSGMSLRELLRDLGRAADRTGAINRLDRLDQWFAAFRATFSGEHVPLATLYRPVLQAFAEAGVARDSSTILGETEQVLARLDQHHGGLVPMIAHNDLWPGNFIVRDDQLIAVDWERATEGRAPLFDYYWMIIAAVLEYLVGVNGYQDYSAGFRQFLGRKDSVCSHAHGKLEQFIMTLGFGREQHRHFLQLFLLEWSVQGYLALGTVTGMDCLALGELEAFMGRNRGPEINIGQNGDIPASRDSVAVSPFTPLADVD
jgi:hypothetical protein